MSLKNLPDEMLGRIMNYTDMLRVDKHLDKVYNHSQYDIYKDKYKSMNPKLKVPDYNDNLNYLDEINKLYYIDYRVMMKDKYSWIVPCDYDNKIHWNHKYEYIVKNGFPRYFMDSEINGLTNLSINGYNSLGDYIPEEIGKLTGLNMLSINIRLTIMPIEIGNLTGLKSLYCRRNKLKVLPKEIGKLVNLEVLDCSYNDLESLPKEIGNLSRLKELTIADNKLIT